MSINFRKPIEILKNLPRKRFFIPIIFLFVLILGGAGYYFLAKQNDSYQKGMSAIERYEKMMREDTYGGKTPEETLKLFVEALKKEDIELASKYFMLDGNGSREKWLNGLRNIKETSHLQEIANEIETKAVPNPKDSIHEGDFKYVIYKDNGIVDVTINMELNKYSQVWKIESL